MAKYYTPSLLLKHSFGQWTLCKSAQNYLIKNAFQAKLQRYTYIVLQTIQMKLILLCVWAERAIFGSAKTALKFKYEI